jgi:Protein of unknown function (DUF3567)
MKLINSARATDAAHATKPGTLDMEMIYDSDAFCVVRIELPQKVTLGVAASDQLGRGGYEIVDKFGRKEIFIEGAMAASFKDGVDKLIETRPSEEEIDDYLDRFSALMQQPLIAH